MIDKRVQSAAEALQGVKNGSTVLVGGFGQVGHPMALIDGLIEAAPLISLSSATTPAWRRAACRG